MGSVYVIGLGRRLRRLRFGRNAGFQGCQRHDKKQNWQRQRAGPHIRRSQRSHASITKVQPAQEVADLYEFRKFLKQALLAYF